MLTLPRRYYLAASLLWLAVAVVLAAPFVAVFAVVRVCS